MLKKLKLTDYLIIIFSLILIIAVTLFLNKKNLSNLPIEKETKIMFDVFFRGISISSEQMPFKVGDEAFITIRNVPYTKLKIADVNGHSRLTYVNSKNKDGYAVATDVATPNLYDFVVRLEDNAKKTPDGYVVGGNKIKMGMPVIIEGQLYRYQGSVSNVFEIGESSEESEQ